jgi:uncharacterized protein (DUF2147 family)
MSKRRKKNRHAKLPMSPAAKPGYRGVAVTFLAAAIVLSVGIWWWKLKFSDVSSAQNSTALANAANPAAGASNSEFEKLKGRWQRPDGGYVLEIKSIADNGAVDAGYFNPKSIRVAKAEVTREGDATKVFIELRDVNYPGSTYTLTYDPASDQLKGIYYQAVEKQRFPVAFVRVK